MPGWPCDLCKILGLERLVSVERCVICNFVSRFVFLKGTWQKGPLLVGTLKIWMWNFYAVALFILFNRWREETNKHIHRCVLSFKVVTEGDGSLLRYRHGSLELFSELLKGHLLGPIHSCLPFKEAAGLPCPLLMCRNQGFWSLRGQAE